VTRPERHGDPDALAGRIVEQTGGDVRLALPLGIGKATHVGNALYRRAAEDRSIRLRIFTALTLEPPTASEDMERRFVEPLRERLFGGYVTPAYAGPARRGELPPNVEVYEFFFQAGQWLDASAAQRTYISANYTHAARFLIEHGLNVFAQTVARPDEGDRGRLSVASNSDIVLDVLDRMRSRGGHCLLVGEVSSELPFMPGPAALPEDAFDHVIEGAAVDTPLFAMPHPPVSDDDHAVGLRCASLVPDGGTLQIGIGSIGDAFGSALLMRHRAPDLFARTIERLGTTEGAPAPETGSLKAGLYGASEMFVPCFLPLYRAGILKRKAADGALLHTAFFVGTRDFYRELRGMPEAERAMFRMCPISFVNELYGDEAAKRRDRVKARFVNNAMLATALGAIVSDALEDGRVVSGVGGQYNFVAQAHALKDARGIMALNATRDAGGDTHSNIVWSYGHTTIPRHLRDIVVTEYGVADLRSSTDRDCAVRMLALTDARFQGELLEAAKSAGKVESDYAPGDSPPNRPERIAEALAPAEAEGWCARFPFGSDMTEEEQALMPALQRLSAMSSLRMAGEAAAAIAQAAPTDAETAALRRMGLDAPSTAKERIARALLLNALRA
jgi:hypothetical protein